VITFARAKQNKKL